MVLEVLHLLKSKSAPNLRCPPPPFRFYIWKKYYFYIIFLVQNLDSAPPLQLPTASAPPPLTPQSLLLPSLYSSHSRSLSIPSPLLSDAAQALFPTRLQHVEGQPLQPCSSALLNGQARDGVSLCSGPKREFSPSCTELH